MDAASLNIHDAPAWVALGLSLLTTVFAVVTRNSKEHKKEIHSQGERLTKIENEMRHLPTKDMVHDLQIAIATMGGKMDVVAARVSSIDAISRRVQEAMMEKDQ